MYSQQGFTPGKKSGSSKMINYVAAYNALFPNSQQLTCAQCGTDKYDKFVVIIHNFFAVLLPEKINVSNKFCF